MIRRRQLFLHDPDSGVFGDCHRAAQTREAAAQAADQGAIAAAAHPPHGRGEERLLQFQPLAFWLVGGVAALVGVAGDDQLVERLHPPVEVHEPGPQTSESSGSDSDESWLDMPAGAAAGRDTGPKWRGGGTKGENEQTAD